MLQQFDNGLYQYQKEVPEGMTISHLLLCRRLLGRYLLSPFIDVLSRISEIQNRKYEAEMDKLLQLDTESLKKIYQEAQKDKRVI